ncbi:FeoA family protein [Tuwongella immobilis]|uniref:Ferrous iron transporter FeoA-like domain-containing protein n=1 Tax=Tuwongella immobilis TaxID=692036 RepID=A0A6C2YN38_9BACT|nr:FeoA family protein [Tuwongella immobilis]VIP03030.1 family protein : FeoA family protein OS=Planctomyces limnophilus (strain ATCC 43296 / DSM 3776 / IFAM 1008 / 290) GN=Plim_2696 PE=4 SV=1: FeoA [Tuwongella immobilis]VTS03178.1 family protein : FeoA family protein OS=Planctomyces limnophilus (strain ATCC 43296 / DSM 3776 / IFAM 1008 / 290) GN=Plim_2696 PE=4 SV=1: FeoA [Tuwongella immobilis]
MVPLEFLRAGEWAEVEQVVGDGDWVHRMAELGLRTGCKLQMLRPGSPCMLAVGATKLCLRCDDCGQVLVRPVSDRVRM